MKNVLPSAWSTISNGFDFGRGSYGINVDVFWKKMPIDKNNREIERELYAFGHSGNCHENLVRFIGSDVTTINGVQYKYLRFEYFFINLMIIPYNLLFK